MLIHNEAILSWQRGYIKISFVEFLAVEFNSASTIRRKSSAMNPNLKHKLISTVLIVLSQLIAALMPIAQLASIVDRIHRRKRRGFMSLLDVIARVERIDRQPGKSRTFWVRLGRTSAWWNNCLLGIVVPEEWRENFTMPKESFMKLREFVGPFVEKQTTSFCVPIPVES